MTTVALPLSRHTRLPARSWRHAFVSAVSRYPEQGVVSGLLLTLYVVVGWWLRDVVGYAIGDAIARSANAVYVVASRDPHLAAIGFYWPPLSSFIQLPLVPLLRPSGHADLAGPISTAICMAATCLVLMRLASSLGLGRRTAIAVGLVFGLNPVVVFYAANGMSEASCFLCLTVGMWGFIRFHSSGRMTDLTMMAVGLALGAMARVEVLVVAFVVSFIATFQWAGLPRSALRSFSRMAVAVLPTIYLFLLWMGVQWVLLRDPLFFVHTAGRIGSHLDLRNNPAAAAYQLPQAKDKVAVALWLLELVWFFGPTLFLGAAYAVIKPRRARVPLGLLGAAATFEAVQLPYRLRGNAYNDPRYFTPLVVLGTVLAIWLLAEVRHDITSLGGLRQRALWRICSGVVVASLIVGAVAGTVAEANPKRARVVREDTFFARVLVRSRPYVYGQEWKSWRRVARSVDRLLAAPGGPHRVICDATSCNPAVTFSTRPGQYVVDSDRDYQSILTDPVGRFDLAITTGTADPISALLTPGDWHRVMTVQLSGLSNSQAVTIWQHNRTVSSAQEGVTPR